MKQNTEVALKQNSENTNTEYLADRQEQTGQTQIRCWILEHPIWLYIIQCYTYECFKGKHWSWFQRQEREFKQKNYKKWILTLVLLNPDRSCLCEQYRSRSVGFGIIWYEFTYLMGNSADPDQLATSEANWSGSGLFPIKYVNSYQQSEPLNLIGWKLKVSVAS